jgi:hypothetical protein
MGRPEGSIAEGLDAGVRIILKWIKEFIPVTCRGDTFF